MDNIHLVVPAPEHEADAMAFAEEVMQADGDGIHGSAGLRAAKSYSAWLEIVAVSAAGTPLTNLFPSDTCFAVRQPGGKIVGIINIRHKLDSEFMRNYGGHIGYTVRPDERRRGCAKQMLRLALVRCRELGIERALLTCDPSNIASCRTIEACGGIMENELPYQGSSEMVCRYWIDTARNESKGGCE